MATLVGVVALDPLAAMRSAPDFPGWVSGQQRLDRVMSRAAPPLFLSTGLSAIAASAGALASRRRAATGWRLLAAGAVAGAIAVTLRINEPTNRRLRSWSPSDPPPPDWRVVRARWDRAHRARRLLVGAAGVASWRGR